MNECLQQEWEWPSHRETTASRSLQVFGAQMLKGLTRPPRSHTVPACARFRSVCLCVLPSHTPNSPRCAPQPAGLTCKQAAFAGGRATCSPLRLCWGKSTLAKSSGVPCQVENHWLPQAQGQFKLPQTGCSGHSYVVKFPFLGALGVMGNLKCQTAVHLLVWDGTVPMPCNAPLPPGSLEEGPRPSWECVMSCPGFRSIPRLRNFR